MKKLFYLVLVLITFSLTIMLVSGNSDIKVSVDNKLLDFDVSPKMINGTTLVPLRTIFNALNAEVKWDSKTQTVTAFKQGVEVSLKIGESYGTINGKRIDLRTPGQVIGGRTLVPGKFIAESLGAKVDWDSINSTLVITTNKEKINNSTQVKDFDEFSNYDGYEVPNYKGVEYEKRYGLEKEVFPGFFENVDYSNPNLFLQTGWQTYATDRIKEIAKDINDKKDISTLEEIYSYVSSLPYANKGEKFALSADQLLDRGLTGCTDYGLVFASLTREKDIPTVFVQSAKTDWISDVVNNKKEQNFVRGHIFLEVFIDNEWILVDSTTGEVYKNYDNTNFNLPGGYYTFAKSIDVRDTGIQNEMNNASTMKQLFINFDLKTYEKPEFEILNLTQNENRHEKLDEIVFEKNIKVNTDSINKQVTCNRINYGKFYNAFNSYFFYNTDYVVSSENTYQQYITKVYNTPTLISISELSNINTNSVNLIFDSGDLIDNVSQKATLYSKFQYFNMDLEKGIYIVYLDNEVSIYVNGIDESNEIDAIFKGDEDINYYELIFFEDEDVVNENLKFMELTNEELFDVVDKYFYDDKFYTVGLKEPAEHLRQYVNYYQGYAVDSWLARSDKPENNHAIIIDNSSSATWLTNESTKKEVSKIISEIYQVKNNGIYLFENGDQKILYLKTNIYDYDKYIDFLYGRNEENFDSYKYSTDRNVKIIGENKSDQSKEVNNTLIVGNKLSVETFSNEFDLKGDLTSYRKDLEQNINKSKLQVFLVDSNFYNRNVEEMYPQIISQDNNTVTSFTMDNKRIVILKAASEEELIKLMTLVDKSILTKDYNESFELEGVKTFLEQQINEININNNNLIDTGKQRIVYFEANPEKGFNYPYVIILPSSGYKSENLNSKRYLVVEPNNFGYSSDNYNDHIRDVLYKYKNTLPGSFLAEKLWAPRMMPILPRPYLQNSKTSIYTHSLDSTTVFLEDIYDSLYPVDNKEWTTEDTMKMFNLEKQMYNMIEDAKERLNDADYNLEEKVFMVGFSASGNFVNRYTTIYPEQIKASYSGAINSNAIIPADKYKRKDLIYPVGVAEHEYLFGTAFDLQEYNNVAKIVYMGEQDTNDTFDYKSPFDQDEKNLIIDLFGEKMFPDRWENVQKAYSEVGGQGLFLTNTEEGHGMGMSDRQFVLEFFKDNRDSDRPVYREKSQYTNLVINVIK